MIKEKNHIFKEYKLLKPYLEKFYIFLCILLLYIFVIKTKCSKNLINIKRNDNYNKENINFLDEKIFYNKIKRSYLKNNYINLNEIESTIKNGRKWVKKYKKENNEINIGFQIDPDYVLRCMMTLASIMDSQKKSTKIRFHFAVVLNFEIEKMVKIYSLRNRIRDDVEFNFYNAKRVEKDLIGLNTKGPGAVSKLLLPELLSDDIERLLVFDTGDLIIIKDLTELYNWNITGYLYAGTPAGSIGRYAKISRKIFDIYINVGNFLIDVKRVKENKMYEKFVKYKNAYHSTIGDQDLLNDVAFGKITYLPFKYGMISPYLKDQDSENAQKNSVFSFVKIIKYKNKYNFLPKNEEDFLRMGYSPYVIHHMHSKWMNGGGLTIYRKLAQYYIKYAGIWDELCEKYSNYCKI